MRPATSTPADTTLARLDRLRPGLRALYTGIHAHEGAGVEALVVAARARLAAA